MRLQPVGGSLVEEGRQFQPLLQICSLSNPLGEFRDVLAIFPLKDRQFVFEERISDTYLLKDSNCLITIELIALSW